MKTQSAIKYTSVEDVRDHRDKLAKTFEDSGGLPDYLSDYFDEKLLKLKTQEFYNEKRRLKFTNTAEEKSEYFEKLTNKFWSENDFQLIKKKRRIGSHLEPVFVEPPRNNERAKDEIGLTQEEIKILIKMCEKDMYLFSIRYFKHYLQCVSSKFHKYLYSYLSENTNNRKSHSRGFKHAIAAPRGNAKSSIISAIYPLWCIAYNKKKFIILVSDTIGQAKDFLADITREIANNELLLRDFPHLAGKGAIWRADEIITANDIKVLALGTGSKIRGRKYGTDRPGLLIFDDVENSEMVRSESEREFIRTKWFNRDVLHVYGAKGTHTDFLFVGTILGNESLLNKVIDPAEYPDWKSRVFKAVTTFSNRDDLWDEWEKIYKNRFDEERIENAREFYENNKEAMLRGTEVLWPEGDPYYDLMVSKITDLSAFNSEKQNNPLDSSKILISLEEMRFENFNIKENEWMMKAIKNPRNPRYGALDPALGKKTTNDFSCICSIVRDLKTGYIFVLDFSLKRRIVDKQIEDIIKFHTQYQYSMFAVETNLFQLVIADNLRKLSRTTGIYMPIKDVIVKNDKRARLEKHAPIIRDGTVIFDKLKAKSSLEYDRAIKQISTFIGDGSDGHDDAVDGLSLVLDLVTTPKFKLRTKQAKKDNSR